MPETDSKYEFNRLTLYILKKYGILINKGTNIKPTAQQAQLGPAAQMEEAYTAAPSLATAAQAQAGQGTASQMQAAQGQAAQGISAQGMGAQIGQAGTFGGAMNDQIATGLAAQAQSQGLGYDPSAGAAGLQSIMQSQLDLSESQRDPILRAMNAELNLYDDEFPTGTVISVRARKYNLHSGETIYDPVPGLGKIF